jgi:CRISPR-associated protein Csb1
MATLTLKKLQEMTQKGAAARCRVTLQPAGGEGTKVFPPTYAGTVYATEKRRLPGHADPVDCVLLDSVQSQANRMEEALQHAIDSGRFKTAGVTLPLVEVDFTSFFPGTDRAGLRLLEPVGKVTSLEAPHRIVDAILRDSIVVEDNKPFRAKAEKDESSYGQRLRRATAQNATALFELCPTALLFGMWDSTGPKGGLGAKFERAMVSEIVGIDAVFGVKTSSRLDPLAIRKDAGPLYRRKDGGYTVDPDEAVDELKEGRPTGRKTLFKPKKTKEGSVDVYHTPGDAKYPDQGRPSEANHGNVTPSFGKYTQGAEGPDVLQRPTLSFDYRLRAESQELSSSQRFVSDWPVAREGSIAPGGVTINSAEQTVVLSFPALRRLRFPINGEPLSRPNVDVAARTVLAALGLCAAALAAEAGLDLRSRCLLWPTAPLSWELLGKPGEIEKNISVSADEAFQLLKEAIGVATSTEIGLPWRTAPLRLVPSSALVGLVVKSQQLALAQAGEGGE